MASQDRAMERMLVVVRAAVLLTAMIMGCYPDPTFVSDDASAIDGSVDALIDAAVDSALADTSAAPDSGTDTMSAPEVVDDTALPRGCVVGMNVFCADWDTSSEPTFGFTAFLLEGGGTFAAELPSFSGPRAFRSTIPSGGALQAATVHRDLTAPTPGSVTRIEARLMLSAATFPEELLLLKLQRPGGRGATLALGANGLYAEALGSYRRFETGVLPPVSSWFHVRIDTSLKITGALLRVYVDDVLVVDETNASTVTDENAMRQLVVGLYTSTPRAGITARYDNVTLDYP
jgi:hypothetical protein